MKGKKLPIVAGVALWGLFVSQDFGEAKIPVERIPTRSVSISHAFADVEEGKLRVAGQVSRWHKVHFPGHVDLTVYDSHGKLLSRQTAQLSPRIMSRRGGRLDLPFSSTFNFVPPEGSTIRVQYHASIHRGLE